jgi:hypothetical protein
MHCERQINFEVSLAKRRLVDRDASGRLSCSAVDALTPAKHADVEGQFMNRNMLYLVIGGLIVIVAGLGYYVYDKETRPQGIELKIGEGGVSIQEN